MIAVLEVCYSSCSDVPGAINANVKLPSGETIGATLVPAHDGYHDRNQWVAWGDPAMWLTDADAGLPFADDIEAEVSAAAHKAGLKIDGEGS